MFIGEHSHSIDEKGRLSIPVKYRLDLAAGVVITRGLDQCLTVFPRQEWETIARRIADLPLSQKKSRTFARLMLAGAWDAQLDGQGRVVLPEYLRRYAGLNKQVIVAGLYNKLEVWDEDSWSAYRQEAEASSAQIAEELAGLGI